jgi:hypothetical protein
MLTESGPHIGGHNRPVGPNKSRRVMCFAPMRVAAAIVVLLTFASGSAMAQSASPKAGTQRHQPAKGESANKVDEFAEAARLLGGPAANPECVWLGKRVVGLIWRDDLDTAFRHLDLYDRFGCPAGHIQAAFRCLVRQGPIALKPPDTLAKRVHSCWINPTQHAKKSPAAAAPTSAAAEPKTTDR